VAIWYIVALDAMAALNLRGRKRIQGEVYKVSSFIKVFLGLVFGLGLMAFGVLFALGGVVSSLFGSSLAVFLVGGLIFLAGVAILIVSRRA